MAWLTDKGRRPSGGPRISIALSWFNNNPAYLFRFFGSWRLHVLLCSPFVTAVVVRVHRHSLCHSRHHYLEDKRMKVKYSSKSDIVPRGQMPAHLSPHHDCVGARPLETGQKSSTAASTCSFAERAPSLREGQWEVGAWGGTFPLLRCTKAPDFTE